MFIVLKINKKKIIIFLVITIIILGYISRDKIREGLRISYRKYYNINLSDENIDSLKNGLNIIYLDYEWKEELNYINKPDKIIYHHSARDYWSPEGINEYHKARGWSGIGYNYYIRKDGSIYGARPENSEGAHTKGENSKSIGICLEGNFQEGELTKEQVDSLINLSVYISLKHDIYKIIGHKDVYETLCPGENFPIKEIKNKVIREIKSRMY